MDGLTGLLEILDSSSVEELLTGEKEGPEVDEVGIGGVLKPILKYLKSGLKKAAKGSKKTQQTNYLTDKSFRIELKKELKIMEFPDKYKKVRWWRGVDKWYPGTMVKKGKFIGGPTTKSTHVSQKFQPKDTDLFVTQDKNLAAEFAKGRGVLLEFHVPKTFEKLNFTSTKDGYYWVARNRLNSKEFKNIPDIGFFDRGLPKKYLVNVHKYDVKF
jgi:hypothetical protein